MTATPLGKLSVALVCSSFSLGGSERNVIKIASGLDPARFSVRVIGLSGDGPLRKEVESRGIPVVETDWTYDPRQQDKDFARLEEAVAQAAPDILHVFNYPAVYFGVAAGTTVGVPVRVVAIQALDTWKGWIERIMDRLMRPAVTLYLADGEGARRFAIRHQGLDAARVRLLYDGPDLDGLTPSSSREVLRGRLGLRSDCPVVGVVARLQDRHKGQSVFLRSVAQLPESLNAQFILVGGGEDEAMLRGLARDLRLENRVVFAGPQPQLGDVLHALDILVIPSLRYESVPKILLEGMGVGRAVIASRMGDIPEFLRDGVTGILVEPGDPDSLAAAILHLVNHSDVAEALGGAARKMLSSKGITLQQSLKTHADLYECLATSREEAPGPLLRSRVRRAMTVYRLLRLGDERGRWLMSQRPWRRR
jgi:glycosyltransferase involved in cell wall biosynthesis